MGDVAAGPALTPESTRSNCECQRITHDLAVPHIDDGLTTSETFDLEVVRVAIDEEEPCRSAAAVRLELLAVHLADRNRQVRHDGALTAPPGLNMRYAPGCCVSPTPCVAALHTEDG